MKPTRQYRNVAPALIVLIGLLALIVGFLLASRNTWNVGTIGGATSPAESEVSGTPAPAASATVERPPGSVSTSAQAPAETPLASLQTGLATELLSTPALLLPELGLRWVDIPLSEPTSGMAAMARSYVCPWVELDRESPHYTYQVKHVYPHDPQAYTQGLIYRDGLLIEGTGLYGQSSLRKVELQTGQVLQKNSLAESFFGEGITELGDRIFQLTWKEQTGFIYDLDSFRQIGSFAYPTQGWGITHDGTNLIMSDGSAWLRFLDPENQQMIAAIPILAGTWAVEDLNELEFIQGEIWANVYQTSCIARIDPGSGGVVGWIDLAGLLTPQEMLFAEVPNGIAYDDQKGRIFVTGKFWPKLFEIQIVPKSTP